MKKFIFLLSGILLSTSTVYAQMTLEDCLIYAREHAHANAINRLETEKAEMSTRIAVSNLLPYIGFNFNGNLSFGRNIDPETNTYDNKQTLSSGLSLNLSLPLFDGLVNFNQLKATKTAAQRRKEAYRINADKISFTVIESFYNVAYCHALVNQMKGALHRDLQILKSTETGVRAGIKSEADMADMKALIASDEYELTNQQNLLAKAYMKLKFDMGMEATSDSIPLDFNLSSAFEPGTAASSYTYIHPEIREASLGVKEDRYYLRAARGAFFPRLSFTAGISTSYYKMLGSDTGVSHFSQQWHDNMGQYLGISLTIPVFTGFSNINKLKRAKLNLRQSQEKLRETEFRIDKEKAEAAFDLSSANKEYAAAKARLEAEQLAFSATSRKYELGAASAIDLYTASAKLSVAQATAQGKQIQIIIKKIVFDYYLGKPLITDYKNIK